MDGKKWKIEETGNIVSIMMPLLSAQVSPINERLRDVPNSKMLVDVVRINVATSTGHLKKAVQFVCGNTLVCETIKEARSVAFDRLERNKVKLALS